jgi:hypothetical protein
MAGFDWNKFIQSREAKATGIGIGTALAAKLLGLGWGGSLATGAIAGGGYWGLDKFLEPKIKEVDKVPEWVDNEDKYNTWRSQNDSERMLLERAQADYAQEMKAQRKAKKAKTSPHENQSLYGYWPYYMPTSTLIKSREYHALSQGLFGSPYLHRQPEVLYGPRRTNK